ncbi:hypothetical protein CPB86DRAFT_746447 [Serendipita vermifera]|nr:hypothetical protein CPB86DRAFT_746447 [Serendipita vermifera]
MTFKGSQRVYGPRWMHPLILTSVFLGTQMIWSTEAAYASPFLHSLGLSKAETAIVFLAAPLSGLLVQPLIGALADHSKSRFGRRRPFMITGSILCAFSLLGLAWSTTIAKSQALAIIIAITAFYCVDFTINAVIAADRALVVDILPQMVQQSANLWICRMTSFGSLIGFFIGHLKLGDLPIIGTLGRTQLQILSALVAIGLVSLQFIVSGLVKEKVLIKDAARAINATRNRTFKAMAGFIRQYTKDLPARIKNICWILFLSWIGWFPFMFFGALWISENFQRENAGRHMENIHEQAAQAAARSMMYQALVAFLSSVFLPLVVAPRQDHKPVFQLPQRNETMGRNVHPLFGKRLDLVTIWFFSHGVFASCLFATLWTKSHAGITIIYAISGFPSALLHWAPHALLGEAILTEEELVSPSSEASSLMDRDGAGSLDANLASTTSLPTQTYVKDNPGIVLGIANVAVVCPQFLVIALSSIVFAIFEPNRSIIPKSVDITTTDDTNNFDSLTIVFL